jgi:hypothetical protein
MEHGGCTDTATQMPRISGDGKQRLGRRAEKQVVYHDLVLVSDRGDLGRHCEDQGEIADRQQIGLAGGKPVPRRRALAFWAMAVATRVVGDPAVTAILAALDMTAEGGRAARSPTLPGADPGSHARHWLGASQPHGDERRLRPPISDGARPG